eukprot:5222120-Amphidinium_carterae.1
MACLELRYYSQYGLLEGSNYNTMSLGMDTKSVLYGGIQSVALHTLRKSASVGSLMAQLRSELHSLRSRLGFSEVCFSQESHMCACVRTFIAAMSVEL